MKPFPLPLRVAAGLAATAVEQVRTLPAKLIGLPVTMASQALQVSMRVQQQVTELAIRGDEVLAGLRPLEETPEWATFDEDIDDEVGDRFDAGRPSAFDRVDDADLEPEAGAEDDRRNGFTAAVIDPWVLEERALAQETAAHPGLAGAEVADEGDEGDAVGEVDELEGAEHGFAAVQDYDGLSLGQLRARLRRFTEAELAELLDYERAHANRPAFVGMLTRRIATVREQR